MGESTGKRMSPISELMEDNRVRLHAIRDSIQDLMVKLVPVMSDQPPQVDGKKEGRTPECEVTEKLLSQQGVIDQISDTLSEVHRRIQI